MAWVLWQNTADFADRDQYAGTAQHAGRHPLARWAAALPAQAIVLLIAAFVGMTASGVFINLRLNKANDLAPAVAKVKADLPENVHLVSLGPVAHRFAYFYGQPIRELDWPACQNDLPADVEYFCFDEHLGDNPLRRFNGRGRKWDRTLGLLPFEWEAVERIPCDPILHGKATTTVVVARVVRRADEQPEASQTAEHTGGGTLLDHDDPAPTIVDR